MFSDQGVIMPPANESIGGIKQCCDPSICLSVCLTDCLLSCNQGGTLLLQHSGKYLPHDQILPVLKLNCVMQFALLNDAA